MSQSDGSPIRVVRLVPTLDFGGVEEITLLLAESLRGSRYRPEIWTFWKAGRAAETLREQGVAVRELGCNPTVYSPRATLRLRNALAAASPDVLHSAIAEANFHAALAATSLRIPVRIIEEVGAAPRSRVGRIILGATYRLVHRGIGVSRQAMGTLGAEGMPPSRLRLLYNAAGAHFFELPQAVADGPFRFVVVARLHSIKNLDTVLRASVPLLHEDRSFQIDVVGDGPERGRLEGLTGELGIGDRIRFHGYQDDTASFLSTSHAFLLPSFSEGSSTALMEAMAARLLCLVSNVEGNREVLGDAHPDQLIDPSDELGWTRAMRQALDMPAPTRHARGEASRARARKHFHPEAYRASLLSIYDELLGERGLS